MKIYNSQPMVPFLNKGAVEKILSEDLKGTTVFVGKVFDLPKNYDLYIEEVKSDFGDDINYEVAVLKKQDSAHGFTEGSEFNFNKKLPDEAYKAIKYATDKSGKSRVDEPQPGEASEMLKLQMLINHLEHNGINVKWNGEHWEPIVMHERTAEEILRNRGVCYTLDALSGGEIRTVTIKSSLQAMEEYANQFRKQKYEDNSIH